MGAKGYKDLIKVWREKTPEILHFTAERLWEAHRIDDYDRLDRAMSSSTPVPQLLRLVLIFDELLGRTPYSTPSPLQLNKMLHRTARLSVIWSRGPSYVP